MLTVRVKIGSKSRARGFTLIEMLVVVTLIMVLLAISLPNYQRYVIRSREAKLRSNLTTLNKVIESYSLDKRKAPQSLDDVVQAGYLKAIPEDITGTSTTWVTENEDPQKAWNPNEPGIASVHSGSNEMSTEGTAYSSW